MHFKEARVKSGMTIDRTAEAVGVGATTINCWSSGAKIPTVDQKRAVAKAFGMDIRGIGYGEPPPELRGRHSVRNGSVVKPVEAEAEAIPAMPDEVAGVRVKNAKQATDRVRAEVAETPLIKGRIEPNGRLGITGGTFEVVSGPAPEAFDSSTWSVIRRMIETIGVDEAIRRMMLVR
jgi:DNA-binding XRE family transcriptional regulator